MARLDAFTTAYIEAALWSSTAYGSLQEEINDPVDADGQRAGRFDISFDRLNYDADDLSAELLAHVVEECRQFQEEQAEVLARAYESPAIDYTPERAGHDFWLTRNGHGAGFWDRGLGAIGRQLTDAAKCYGSEDWYVARPDPEEEAGEICAW